MVGSAASAGTANCPAGGQATNGAGSGGAVTAGSGGGGGSGSDTTAGAGGAAGGDGGVGGLAPPTSTDDWRMTSRSGIFGPHAPSRPRASTAVNQVRCLLMACLLAMGLETGRG